MTVPPAQFDQQIALALAEAYTVFSPLTGDEVARAVAAIQREIGEWGSDRLHAQWARLLATEVWGPKIAVAIRTAAVEESEDAGLEALREVGA